MLDLFTELLAENELHPKFKLLNENILLRGEKEILNDWVKGFIDRDKKIVKEFQKTFHSSFWEFYLYAVFKEAKFEIDFTKNRPDFIITKPEKLYIEAVVSNIKNTGEKEEKRSLKDILSMIDPFYIRENFDYNMREAITRYSNSILSKNKKYQEYLKDKDFDEKIPYIIALSGYEQINYGKNFYYPMMALLYGLYFDNKKDKYDKKIGIKKTDTNSDIPIGFFLDESMAHISAIIFSCTVTLGKLTSLAISQKKSISKTNSVLCIRHDNDFPHFKPQIVSEMSPEYLSDGLFIFHNPFAKYPITKELFNKTNVLNIEFNQKDEALAFYGNNLPIVSRLNLFMGEPFLKSSLFQISQSWNMDMVFSKAKVTSIYFLGGKDYEVSFIDLDDNLDFSIILTEDMLKKYQIEENREFICLCKLKDGEEKYFPKSEEDIELYKKINKVRCLSLNCGEIVDIEAII